MDDDRPRPATGLRENAASSQKPSYDPTQNPLPADAVRAPPGERQIAYPPEFPRAKIHGTPDGTTSVHIGVRPRVHPPKDGPADAREMQQRRPGYGELGFESDADPRASTATRVRHDGVGEDDNGSGNPPTSEQRQARPRMTLQQAIVQWDQTHPSAPPFTLSRSSRKTAAISPVSEPADDGRAHDGIYTYDYGDDGSLPVGGAAQRTRVRAHPPPPTVDEENAYGVPFGERLKAMVKLRREAEERGLVPSVSSADGKAVSSFSPRTSGLVRRPATHDAGKREKTSPRKARSNGSEISTTQSSPAPTPVAILSEPSTPTTPCSRPRPSVPGESQQLSLQSEQSVPVDAKSRGKARRKPVPRYVEAEETPTITSPADGRRTAREGETALIKKQTSEPRINEDSIARATRRERRRWEEESGRKGEARHRSQFEQPQPTSTSAAADPNNMPLTALSLRSQSFLEGATPHVHRTPPISTYTVVPPMPEGEEYDSETEAERQAAWKEYYRLMSTYDGVPSGGGGGFAAFADRETEWTYSSPDWTNLQT